MLKIQVEKVYQSQIKGEDGGYESDGVFRAAIAVFVRYGREAYELGYHSYEPGWLQAVPSRRMNNGRMIDSADWILADAIHGDHREELISAIAKNTGRYAEIDRFEIVDEINAATFKARDWPQREIDDYLEIEKELRENENQ